MIGNIYGEIHNIRDGDAEKQENKEGECTQKTTKWHIYFKIQKIRSKKQKY
jgi:hypothetical protein